jgi:hypothetical protein
MTMPHPVPNIVRLLVAGVTVAAAAAEVSVGESTALTGSPAPTGTETAPLT